MNNIRDFRYYYGLSGLQLPVPQYLFPLEHQGSSRLQYYATFFNSIEINSTFYKLPMAATFDKWNKAVPEKFIFTLKFSKQVTHSKGLVFNEADVVQFLSTVNKIGAKKGCLLIQFPPSVNIHFVNQLAKLLSLIRSLDPTDSWDLAFEFRDESWYLEEVYALIVFYKSNSVVHDKAGKPSPYMGVNSRKVYVRFHGPRGDYRGSYEDDFLYEYSLYIKEWLLEDKTVYVYFNNTMGDAFNNLRTLNGFLDDI
jgi:uncharacterized protein YecE (DUF72 family)